MWGDCFCEGRQRKTCKHAAVLKWVWKGGTREKIFSPKFRLLDYSIFTQIRSTIHKSVNNPLNASSYFCSTQVSHGALSFHPGASNKEGKPGVDSHHSCLWVLFAVADRRHGQSCLTLSSQWLPICASCALRSLRSMWKLLWKQSHWFL